MSNHWKKLKKSNPSYRIVETPAPPATPNDTSQTETGRAISAKNATKHGCCAVNTLLLPSEREEDFKSLEASWCRAYNPQTDAERHMVADLVNADWFFQRATRALAEIESSLHKSNPDPNTWTEDQERKLARHMRYKTAAGNIVAKARKAIEDYRKSRNTESDRASKLTIAKERLEVYKRKNRPEPTWKEHLAEMKSQATALGFKPPEFNPTKR